MQGQLSGRPGRTRDSPGEPRVLDSRKMEGPAHQRTWVLRPGEAKNDSNPAGHAGPEKRIRGTQAISPALGKKDEVPFPPYFQDESRMEMVRNALNWFEIPVADFERARKFYQTIFDFEMPENAMGPNRMGFFLHDPKAGGIGGAIVSGPSYVPTDQGALIYLNGGTDLLPVLNRVEKAGGKILTPKTLITRELGFVAIVRDSEGNRVALHSMA